MYLTVHTSGLGYLCQRGTLMRWGTRPCDGLAGPAKCAACELQHRGAPRSLAWALGALPPGLARTLSSVPGKLGTALGMSDLIGWNQQRQRALVAAVDRLVLLTRWALDAVAANGAPAAKLALNRLGSDLVGARPKPGPEQRPSVRPLTVGYLGRLDPIKGIADLVRAAAALPREVDIRVEIRGPRAGQAERRHLSELVGLAGGDPRIRFEDAVPFADVPSLLSRYDLLCCPSVCLEGGPTVAIEAHAVGTPVVGSRIGGLAEMIEDGTNGRLVAPGDWRALSRVLHEVWSDPSTVDRWRRALPPVRTMDQVAADYLRLYAGEV